jgi:hypothetical protein
VIVLVNRLGETFVTTVDTFIVLKNPIPALIELTLRLGVFIVDTFRVLAAAVTANRVLALIELIERFGVIRVDTLRVLKLPMSAPIVLTYKLGVVKDETANVENVPLREVIPKALPIELVWIF